MSDEREQAKAERARRLEFARNLPLFTVFGLRVRNNTSYYTSIGNGQFRRFAPYNEWGDVVARQDLERWASEMAEMSIVAVPVDSLSALQAQSAELDAARELVGWFDERTTRKPNDPTMRAALDRIRSTLPPSTYSKPADEVRFT